MVSAQVTMDNARESLRSRHRDRLACDIGGLDQPCQLTGAGHSTGAFSCPDRQSFASLSRRLRSAFANALRRSPPPLTP